MYKYNVPYLFKKNRNHAKSQKWYGTVYSTEGRVGEVRQTLPSCAFASEGLFTSLSMVLNNK